MKEYRAVGLRCAVDLNVLAEIVPKGKALSILERLGLRILCTRVVDVAAYYAGRANYRVGCRMTEAPRTFDCSSFVKWCYGCLGIWMPRRAVQQSAFAEPIAVHEVGSGDLLFTSGNGNYYHQDPSMKIGHVGIATSRGTVLHASMRRRSVVESSRDEFLETGTLRGAGRIVPPGSDLVTLVVRASSAIEAIETSDDVQWLIAAHIAEAGSP